MVREDVGALALALVRLELRKVGERGEASPMAESAAQRPTLTCAADGRWFMTPTGIVRLHRRPVLRRIFQVLVDMRRTRPGVAISREDLIAAAWPGERFTPASGANRLYFNIAMLRQLGLRATLLRREDGYYLDHGALLDERSATPEFVKVA